MNSGPKVLSKQFYKYVPFWIFGYWVKKQAKFQYLSPLPFNSFLRQKNYLSRFFDTLFCFTRINRKDGHYAKANAGLLNKLALIAFLDFARFQELDLPILIKNFCRFVHPRQSISLFISLSASLFLIVSLLSNFFLPLATPKASFILAFLV